MGLTSLLTKEENKIIVEWALAMSQPYFGRVGG
jgi:hypothetical protein